MADSGHLTPPPTSDANKQKIWTETKKRLDRFLPNLFSELFPVSESPKDEPPTSDKEAGETPETSTSANSGETNEKQQEESSPSPSPADVD